MTLSRARDFQFEAVSDLTAQISFLLKQATLENQKLRGIENQTIAKKINDERIFEPKTQDPLDNVIEILYLPNPEHKKTMFPYVKPTVQTADDIEKTQEIIDADFIDLQTEFDKVNDVTTDQLKQKKIEDVIDAVTNEDNPFNSFDDFWYEDDLFNKNDLKETVEASKNILDEINEISDNMLKIIQPVDNRTTQELIDNDFIPIDDRTQQELEDDDYIELESDVKEEPAVVEPGADDLTEPDIDLTSDWDPKKNNSWRPKNTNNKTFNRR